MFVVFYLFGFPSREVREPGRERRKKKETSALSFFLYPDSLSPDRQRLQVDERAQIVGQTHPGQRRAERGEFLLEVLRGEREHREALS